MNDSQIIKVGHVIICREQVNIILRVEYDARNVRLTLWCPTSMTINTRWYRACVPFFDSIESTINDF